jgi:hypothetical protein
MVKTTSGIETGTRNRLKHIARENQTYDQLINGLIEQNRGLIDHKVETMMPYESSTPQDLITSSCRKAIHKTNNTICEAVGCDEKAVTEIQVDTGQSGSITLSLCNNCVSKFSDPAKPEVKRG